ncbi:hypothetical protein [Pediococcus stilesii]|uniref:Uncharacterized protein n=1 Tax=Pediococcus stilesii TaxID=331679 RepID=A0A0R2KUX9_9LACO|nr:hypothetical protein [Pediococcus stilesii]KRN93384.1 hypothetical protein IV81_GL000583 [Pediococcus stilesii]
MVNIEGLTVAADAVFGVNTTTWIRIAWFIVLITGVVFVVSGSLLNEKDLLDALESGGSGENLLVVIISWVMKLFHIKNSLKKAAVGVGSIMVASAVIGIWINLNLWL